MAKRSLAVYGHCTIDSITVGGRTHEQIGGSACYCALVARQFGFAARMVTRFGPDFPRQYLDDNGISYSGASVSDSGTTRFSISVEGAERTLRLAHACDDIPYERADGADCTIASPLCGEISNDVFSEIRRDSRLLLVDPQGFLRVREGPGGDVALRDADLDQAADVVVNGAFFSTGQKCTATSRALVEKPVFDEFVQLLVEKTGKLKVGDGLRKGIEMGPCVDENQMNTVLNYIRIGREEGARLLCGGERLTGPEWDKGYFVEPTIFSEVSPDMRIAREEIFGPVLALFPVEDLDEAIELANRVEFGLSASILTNRIDQAFNYINRIEAGLIIVNLPSAGVEYQLPFGGTKASSTGYREQGSVAIDFYSELRTVYLKHRI